MLRINRRHSPCNGLHPPANKRKLTSFLILINGTCYNQTRTAEVCHSIVCHVHRALIGDPLIIWSGINKKSTYFSKGPLNKLFKLKNRKRAQETGAIKKLALSGLPFNSL